MATISGRLLYDNNRSTISTSLPGIKNVPIVLQKLDTFDTLAVLTDDIGRYSFLNVPNGGYQIVEYYGYQGALVSPGDFQNATSKPLLDGGKTPPITYVTNPAVNATDLDCTTPNTLLIEVIDNDITNLDILNGPVKYTPITEIMDHNVHISPTNLVTIADYGTFGEYQKGTYSETFSNSTYDGIGSGFDFVQTVPHDGEYAIENITSPLASSTTWWSFSDHTCGNEKGRMMIINGDNPGTLLFDETVSVNPNTYYIFSAWILNMIKTSGFQDPELGVRLINSNGEVIINKTLGQLIPPNPNEPEWVQIGSIIYSSSYTSLTIQFISQGIAARGNDYALDDVLLSEVLLPDPLVLLKEINKDIAYIGEIVNYKLTFENTYDYTVTDIFFKDVIPEGLLFLNNSVKVNGVIQSNFNPNVGFSLPNLASHGVLEIEFSCVVTSIPLVNPTINTADITYNYAFIQGGIEYPYEITSNEVELLIEEYADIAVIKKAINKDVYYNDYLTYTIEIINYGPSTSKNVLLTDIVVSALKDVEYSVDGGVTYRDWEGTLEIGDLEYNQRKLIYLRGLVDITSGVIVNTATVTSDTEDPDETNNTSTEIIEVNKKADLSVIKTSCPIYAKPCEQLTYQIIVTNNGPSVSENVVLKDEVSSLISCPRYSLDMGRTWHKWNNTLELGDMEPFTHKVILIKGMVAYCLHGVIENEVSVTSDTYDNNLFNNTYKLVTKINRCF